MGFETIYRESKIILTEGALVERLKAEFHVEMDVLLNHAKLIYDNPKSLELLYRQYINVGQKYNLPIMIMTPTRKVNFKSSPKSKNIISDSCVFLNNIKESYLNYSKNIMVGGLLGCKGDAYSGEKKFDINQAFKFHSIQTSNFKIEKIDFLFAGIMPEINEAIGMAMAMAETRIPYIISFMIRKDGCLMDGTRLANAINLIDDQVNPKPICYMTNCIHPTNLKEALINNKGKSQLKRFRGIQANASHLSPNELNNCKVLQQDDFDNIINEILFLNKQYNLKIVGGCCGTNDKFIENLSKKITISIND